MPRKPLPRAAKDPERKKKLLDDRNLPFGTKKRPLVKEKNVKGLKTHPSYLKMILKAIIHGKHARQGESGVSILRFMERNYPLPANYRRFVTKTLKTALEEGILVKGISPHRYRINPKQKAKLKRTYRFQKKGWSTRKHKTSKKRTHSSSSTVRSHSRETKTQRSKGTRVRVTSSRSSQNQPDGKNTSDKLVWAWQYWDNGWYNYDKAASNVVEATYQEYLKNPGISDVRAVKSGQWTYQVDFRQMIQTNIEHENHTSRRIRRYQIPESDFDLGKKRYN